MQTVSGSVKDSLTSPPPVIMSRDQSIPLYFFYLALWFRYVFTAFQSTKGQFNQHVYVQLLHAKFPKWQKKDTQVKQLFALLESVLVKAARKHVD